MLFYSRLCFWVVFLGGELFLLLVSLVFLFCLFVCFMMATEFELMKNQYVGCR